MASRLCSVRATQTVERNADQKINQIAHYDGCVVVVHTLLPQCNYLNVFKHGVTKHYLSKRNFEHVHIVEVKDLGLDGPK